MIKILVSTEQEKRELLEASEHIHDLDGLDTNIPGVNLIAHLQYNPELIEVKEPGVETVYLCSPAGTRVLATKKPGEDARWHRSATHLDLLDEVSNIALDKHDGVFSDRFATTTINQKGEVMKQQETSDQCANDIPPFSDSKGGRYWLDDGMYSMAKLDALLHHALKVMDSPPIIILTGDNECDNYRVVILTVDESGCLVFPEISAEDAKRIYDDRSNGLCDFTRLERDNNGMLSVWLAGELCVDELVAVRTLVLAKPLPA